MFFSDADGWQAACLAAYILSGLLLAYGRWPVAGSIFAWVLHSSVVVRGSSLVNGGDTLLRLLLFWNMLIALERRFCRKAAVGDGHQVTGVAVLGLFLQMCMVYWFSAMLKSHAVWRTDFTAVNDALALGSLRTAFGGWLAQFSTLGYLATKGTLLLEELGPFFLFVPQRYWKCRMAVVIVFISFHLLLLAPTMRLGFFPYICAAGWAVFIPGQFWDWIAVRYRWRMGDSGFSEAVSTPGDCQCAAGERVRCHLIRGLGIIGIGYMLVWNIVSLLPKEQSAWFSSAWKAPGIALGLRQRWALFASRPSTRDGWMIAEGTLASGRKVDLFTGAAPELDVPVDRIADRYSTFRWRKHLVALFVNEKPKSSSALRDYLVRTWNENHEDRVLSAKLIFRYRVTGHPRAEVFQTEIYPVWQSPSSIDKTGAAAPGGTDKDSAVEPDDN